MNKIGRIWHCRVPEEMACDRFYGFSVNGPNDLSPGHRFDQTKVLVDPYAPAIHFPPAFQRAAGRQPGSNEGRAPLGVVLRPSAPFNCEGDRRPAHEHDAVIYELNIRGFTHEAFDVPVGRRGEDAAFSIQEGGRRTWRVVSDTGLPTPKDLRSTELRVPLAKLSRGVLARSMVILEATTHSLSVGTGIGCGSTPSRPARD